MKINDLKRYKPLDITQISGSPWNTADKVLGLDDKDKVVMAETEEIVTPEDVQSAITQAMEAETARTEDTYAKKGELPPLDDYYTKEQTDAVVSSATQDMATETWVQSQGYLTEHQDLSAYAQTTAVTQDIQTAMASETARTEETYAKIADIPSLDGYAKTTAVTQDIQTAIASETARTEDTYAKKSDIPDLDNYYTKSETDEAIAEAVSGISLDGYWTSGQTKDYVDASITGATADLPTKAWVTGDTASRIETAMASETARTEDTYAKIGDIPSLDGYWTSAQTQNAITAATEDLASKDYVDGQITGITDMMETKEEVVASALTELNTEVLALSGSTASKAWVTGDTETRIGVAMASETARTESDYLKKSLFHSDEIILAGLSKDTVNYKNADSAGNKTADCIQVYGEVPISGTNNRADLMMKKINGVSIFEQITNTSGAKPDDFVLPTFNDVATAITASTADLATEAYVDSAVTAGTQDMATKTWVGQQGYVTDISGKLDVTVFTGYTGSTDTTISSKLDKSDFNTYTGATETALSGKVGVDVYSAYTASTETVLSGKVDNSTFTGYTGDTATALAGKVDNATFTGYTGDTETALAGKVGLDVYSAYTGSTATALAGKQETLVSGTNIKTINNESILGSGNITIQGGGGGGGETVVELTKAQYEALDPPAADTTYIITDADTVDLNDYAMASGLTELSGTVQTLSTTVSNKADKQSVTARASNSNYLPGWNSQGVITGGTAYYNKTQGINGTNYNVFSNSNTNHPAIFAPTSAGTAGQPLLSNGSGAPQWASVSFSFLSQSQYDALTTKDQNCIYFIISDN